jgi:hypothetical protein
MAMALSTDPQVLPGSTGEPVAGQAGLVHPGLPNRMECSAPLVLSHRGSEGLSFRAKRGICSGRFERGRTADPSHARDDRIHQHRCDRVLVPSRRDRLAQEAALCSALDDVLVLRAPLSATVTSRQSQPAGPDEHRVRANHPRSEEVEYDNVRIAALNHSGVGERQSRHCAQPLKHGGRHRRR